MRNEELRSISVCIMFYDNEIMGIKQFFSNAWNKIKHVARVGYNFVKDKIVPNIGRIAKTGLNIMSNLPGKLGMIGKIGTHAISTVDKALDYVPNTKIRDKIRGVLGFTQSKLDSGINKATEIVNRGNDAIDRGKNIINTVRDGVSTLPYIPKGSDLSKLIT